jgi:hypothetical protein
MRDAVEALLAVVRTLEPEASAADITVDAVFDGTVFHPYPSRHRDLPDTLTPRVCSLEQLDAVEWCPACGPAWTAEHPLLSILHHRPLLDALALIDAARAVFTPPLDPDAIVAGVRTRGDLLAMVDEFLEHAAGVVRAVDEIDPERVPEYAPEIAAAATACLRSLAGLHAGTAAAGPIREKLQRFVTEDLAEPLDTSTVAVALAAAGIEYYSSGRAEWWGLGGDDDRYALANALRVAFTPYDTLDRAVFVEVPRWVATTIRLHTPAAVLSETYDEYTAAELETANALRTDVVADVLHSFDEAFAAARRLNTSLAADRSQGPTR